jgi:hypothetical protein
MKSCFLFLFFNFNYQFQQKNKNLIVAFSSTILLSYLSVSIYKKNFNPYKWFFKKNTKFEKFEENKIEDTNKINFKKNQ